MLRALPRSSPIYQLNVALRGIAPPVWRRLLLPGYVPLLKLHRVFQCAFGWADRHLHEFKRDQGSDASRVPLFTTKKISERLTLRQTCPAVGSRLLYVYDMGDGWEHEVVIEQILAAESSADYPRCIDGARACPPEDCGGIPGYEHLLRVLANPKHPDHAELLDWVGGSFDAEVFDRDAANRRLGRLRSLA